MAEQQIDPICAIYAPYHGCGKGCWGDQDIPTLLSRPAETTRKSAHPFINDTCPSGNSGRHQSHSLLPAFFVFLGGRRGEETRTLGSTSDDSLMLAKG